MDCFKYPLDTKTLLRKKNGLKRELAEQKGLIQKKVAVLGGSTTSEVVEQLSLFLLYYGISAEFYESEYGQYWQDAIFGNDKLDFFSPDIIYIHTSWRNIESFPDVTYTEEKVNNLFEQEKNRFVSMWNKLAEKFQCPIIQNNFDRPNYRLLGNRDIWDYRGRSNFIARLNQEIYEYARTHENFYVNDIEYISQDYGLTEWGDSRCWHMYKYAMCIDAIPYVAQSVANIVKSIYGKNKKVLSLDLDNTLWGGVIGDDGIEGIAIGAEQPKGQVYLEFQEYCKKLQQLGVVLTVNSKNEYENAVKGLRHQDSVLQESDFVSIKANWNSKDYNLIEMGRELSLGMDSFVFIDDNPAERELIKKQIPEVAIPEVGEAESYIRVIDHSGYFEATVISIEDQYRTQMYHSRSEAKLLSTSCADYSSYLDALNMTAEIYDFLPIYVQRISQLTNKSNQFNLTTRRCSETDIQEMQKDESYICMCGRLKDKFGDNGIVTIVAGKKEEYKLHIQLWLMSCRVLKRELEYLMMRELVKKASKQGIKEIRGYYYRTEKNKIVADFYREMGFTRINRDEKGNSEWRLLVDEYEPKTVHIHMIST